MVAAQVQYWQLFIVVYTHIHIHIRNHTRYTYILIDGYMVKKLYTFPNYQYSVPSTPTGGVISLSSYHPPAHQPAMYGYQSGICIDSSTQQVTLGPRIVDFLQTTKFIVPALPHWNIARVQLNLSERKLRAPTVQQMLPPPTPISPTPSIARHKKMHNSVYLYLCFLPAIDFEFLKHPLTVPDTVYQPSYNFDNFNFSLYVSISLHVCVLHVSCYKLECVYNVYVFTCVCTCMCVTHSVFVTSVTCLTHSIPSPPLPFIADWCCKFCARLRARISERNLFRSKQSTSLRRSPTHNSPVSFKDSFFLHTRKKFIYIN